MRIDEVWLHTVRLPLVSPFTTSFGTQTDRVALLVEVRATDHGDQTSGWGECVVSEIPDYSSEWLAGSRLMLRDHLVPLLLARQAAGGLRLTAERVAPALAEVRGHRMSKAALETAVLDAELRLAGVSLADHLGSVVDRVPSGVSVGIQDSTERLLAVVEDYLDQGYVRIKLKIKPGVDVEPVAAVRERFGPDVPLQVDANAAYRLLDAPRLRRLDEHDLLLIEQPLGEEDLRQHALLARQLRTPMCLDESVISADAAADAIALGAAAVINIKPGRVGGYLEARRIHDLARAHGVAVWCGGMLETGIGRAANVALAALPGFTLPGDVSASDRFYRTDITRPFVLEDGCIRVPDGPGIGVDPIPEAMAEFGVESIKVG